MRRRFVLAATTALVLTATATAGAPARARTPYPNDGALRMNQLQHLGSHNSYRMKAPWPIPVLVSLLNYGHAPLPLQFGLEGVRQIELDVYWEPDRGGFTVHHIPVVDQRSSCPLLPECLAQIRDWSVANPSHAPLFVQIEPKDDLSFGDKPTNHYDELDALIRSVFPASGLVTPDDVRGAHATIAEALATEGWPTLGRSRGRVLFFLDVGTGPATDNYLAGHPNLEGRVAFPAGQDAQTWSAVFVVNDPVADQTRIRDLVSGGYIVRTRADDDVVLDPVAAAAALAGGAQLLSTDFPSPGHAPEGPGAFAIPGGTPSRCNPVNAPAWCVPADVEVGVTNPRDQTVAVALTGDLAYDNVGTVPPWTITVGPPGDEPANQVSGTATIPGLVGGTATVVVDAHQFLGLPLYVGGLEVTDPDSGVLVNAPFVFATILRSGDDGATATGWWVSTSSFPWKSGTVTWSVAQ